MAGPNKDYINQSLLNQIASMAMQIAERDAIIAEQQQKLENAEVEEMNEGAK